MKERYDWWVVQTKTQAEDIAIKQLKQQGLTSYCPMYRKEIIRNRKSKVELKPLFSNYIFILANEIAHQIIHSIRFTKGVNKLLKIGEKPATVKASLIEQVKQLEANQKNQLDSHFKSGDTVVITEGIYKDLIALFHQDKDVERAVVLLNLLQHETSLIINKHKLQKI